MMDSQCFRYPVDRPVRGVAVGQLSNILVELNRRDGQATFKIGDLEADLCPDPNLRFREICQCLNIAVHRRSTKMFDSEGSRHEMRYDRTRCGASKYDPRRSSAYARMVKSQKV